MNLTTEGGKMSNNKIPVVGIVLIQDPDTGHIKTFEVIDVFSIDPGEIYFTVIEQETLWSCITLFEQDVSSFKKSN